MPCTSQVARFNKSYPSKLHASFIAQDKLWRFYTRAMPHNIQAFAR